MNIQKISYLYTQIKSTLIKTLTRLFALCALVISVSSCATIFTATKYLVAFNTTPEGAGITIENREGKVIFEGTLQLYLQPTKDVALQVYDINNLPDNISKEDLVRIG